MKFTPVSLSCVKMQDEFIKNALDREGEYLLSLSAGRLLAGFYENAGLRSPFVRYGGWESGLIGGHTLGHYLSALAHAAANASYDSALRARFSARLEEIVRALALCQSHSQGEAGFLWGAPAVAGGVEAQFDNVEGGRTNIVREAWVPWYTLHKLFCGLLDAHRLAGSEVALSVARGLGDWVDARTRKWTPALQSRVLSVEYGGMNDCLYALFEMTGESRYLAAAHRFDEEALFDRILSGGKDVLKDRHANTTIPKILGAVHRYRLTGEGRYLAVGEGFFEMVLARHTYVTGGNSEWEHFGADYVLDAERTNCNCESCNVYNMLKLAMRLFSCTGKTGYLDYYDRAFTNAVLSSQHPKTGMTTYFQPMAGGFFKVFSSPFEHFWCCTGSGMESMAKLGSGVFYEVEGGVLIALYERAELQTPELSLRLCCNFPFDERASIFVSRASRPVTLFLRVPDWAAGEIAVSKNGAPCLARAQAGCIPVSVEEGDRLEVHIPVSLRAEGLADAADACAFLYGGRVLAARLGREDMRTSVTGVDVTLPARKCMASERVYFENGQDVKAHPARYLRRAGEEFVLTGGDVSYTFAPINRIFDERYAIYLKCRSGKREEEVRERIPLDVVQVGYGQYENDALHAMRECDSVSQTARGTSRRARAGGYFEYDVKVDERGGNTLSVQLAAEDNGKPLCITAGECVLLNERLLYTQGEARYRREIAIADEALAFAREKIVNGERVRVLTLRFAGERRRASAAVHEFLYVYGREGE